MALLLEFVRRVLNIDDQEDAGVNNGLLNGGFVVVLLCEVSWPLVSKVHWERVGLCLAFGYCLVSGDKCGRFLFEIGLSFGLPSELVQSAFEQFQALRQRRKETIETVRRMVMKDWSKGYYYMFLLAWNGDRENGIEQSYENAIGHLWMTAGRHPKSMVILGWLLTVGRHCRRNHSLALRMFADSSSRFDARFNYSLLLIMGDARVRDENRGREELKKLAEGGYRPAQDVWAMLSATDAPAGSGAPQSGNGPAQDTPHGELRIQQYLVVPRLDLPLNFDKKVEDAEGIRIGQRSFDQQD